jgi:hypothetical protein
MHPKKRSDMGETRDSIRKVSAMRVDGTNHNVYKTTALLLFATYNMSHAIMQMSQNGCELQRQFKCQQI